MLTQIFELLTRSYELLKPFYVVDQFDGAVLFRLGKFKRPLDPGLRVKVPFIDYIYTQSNLITTMQLQPQTLTTKDGKAVVISSIIKYQIIDMSALVLKVYDAVDVVQDVSLGAIKEVVSKSEYSRVNSDSIMSRVAKVVQKDVGEYGFKIHSVKFIDCGSIRSIRLIQDQGGNITDD